jgi:probable addiction module antidote protein
MDTLQNVTIFHRTAGFDAWLSDLKDKRRQVLAVSRHQASHRNGSRFKTECPMKKIETAPFDAADYLDDEEVIAEYLTAALEDPNPDLFLVAVRDVARARGMAQLARDTGLGRESLYKALAPGAKPRYDTVLKVLRALGVKLHVESVHV